MIDLTAPIADLSKPGNFTHIDLYYRGRRAPDSSLVTRCVLLDLTSGAEGVDVEGLAGLSRLRSGDSVILQTGWESYRGTSRYDESPSVDRRLIDRLVDIGVALILIDSPGVYGGARSGEHNAVDQYLADNEAYAVENLVNVRRLTTDRFRLYCFPVYASERNNAPCRVVADMDAPLD